MSSVPEGPMRTFGVPPKLLAEQLAALSGAGYRLTGLSEALDLLDGGCTDPLVALTFDDGYVDFLDHAVGVLAEAKAGATLYMSVGHMGGPADWLGPHAGALGPIMDWSQLADVAATGVEIGNHSLIHHPLDVLPAGQLDAEVRDSRDRLADALARPIRSFAYPHGYNSATVRAVVAKYGHGNACEVGRRLYREGGDRLAVSRLQPTPDHSGDDLVRLVRGEGSSLVPALKRVAQPGWRVARRVALRVFRTKLT
ncbi:polysaccharide deacetylase family protein [Rugosimonospora africana]|uniref:polysaccharide deacetylase family protein n=1 Tax=Rugosimonospora africana TaxID=556532 RepID=UPI001940FF6F|nr:polysaccharide deacetylase family protein [Rugosimonospora africana]